MKLELGINEISNENYHGDKSYLSSSSMKSLLKDREKFHREHVLGEPREQMFSNAFDEGSLTHALILEPEVIEKEFAFFEGFHKRGNAFKEFALQNEGKTLISGAQKFRCEKFKEVFDTNDAAVSLISGGLPEHTVCQILNEVPVKIRTDYINPEKGYIADVKTTGFAADVESFKMTINQYKYNLSAALYSMVAEQFYGKEFDFYFIVISKKDFVCEVYKASEETLLRGRAEVLEALSIYKECIASDVWENPKLDLLNLPQQLDYEIQEV